MFNWSTNSSSKDYENGKIVTFRARTPMSKFDNGNGTAPKRKKHCT